MNEMADIGLGEVQMPRLGDELIDGIGDLRADIGEGPSSNDAVVFDEQGSLVNRTQLAQFTASARARRSAAAGAGISSTWANEPRASAASSCDGSARGLDDPVATSVSPTAASASSISPAALSARIEATIVNRRGGSRAAP